MVVAIVTQDEVSMALGQRFLTEGHLVDTGVKAQAGARGQPQDSLSPDRILVSPGQWGLLPTFPSL